MPLGGQCEYLIDYLRIDFANNPVEVIKLQLFLQMIEGESALAVTGIFDQATHDAVGRFQEKYFGDILAPWGHDDSTGYVYILTKKKINEIVCQTLYALTPDQEVEIAQFRAFLGALSFQGIDAGLPSVPGSPVGAPSGSATSTNESEDQDSEGFFGGIINTISGNPTLRNVAGAVFSGPEGFDETMTAIGVFLIALVASAIISDWTVYRLYRSTDKHILWMRILATAIVVILVAIAILALVKYLVIVLPLIITILAILAGIAVLAVLHKRHKPLSLAGMNGPINLPPPAK